MTENYAKKMDRLAWKQRLEDIERVRKKTRRKEWLQRNLGRMATCFLLGCLTILFVGFLVLVLRG